MVGPNAAVIQGNYIGTDFRGNRLVPCDFRIICDPTTLSVTSNLLDGISIDVGNGALIGVANPLLTNANGVTIGSSLGNNVIAYNGRNGITLTNGNGNSIQANQFLSNNQLAIDNGNDGVTPNHPCGGGPTNFPELTLANT